MKELNIILQQTYNGNQFIHYHQPSQILDINPTDLHSLIVEKVKSCLTNELLLLCMIIAIDMSAD